MPRPRQPPSGRQAGGYPTSPRVPAPKRRPVKTVRRVLRAGCNSPGPGPGQAGHCRAAASSARRGSAACAAPGDGRSRAAPPGCRSVRSWLDLGGAQADEIARLVRYRQKPLVQLAKGGLGVQVGKQRGMKPFGQLLDGHELVRAVVELMPDRMKGLVVLRLDPC